jgi:predicted chitinase
MLGSLPQGRYDGYAEDFNRALIQADCRTVNRVAMFCAQVGHESVGLKFMEEIASGAEYEGRHDLGNTQPGDGRRFKGRGPIQLTGRSNYRRFGEWAHSRDLVNDADFFVSNPTEVATSRWGFLAATWYWTVARSKLNSFADAGDILAATKAVNGGTNGLADRTNRWNTVRRLGNALLPSVSAHSPVLEEDFEMIVPAGENEHVVVPAVNRPPFFYVFCGWGQKVRIHQAVYVGPTPQGPGANFKGGTKVEEWDIDSDRPGPIAFDPGTVGVSLRYTASHPFTVMVG